MNRSKYETCAFSLHRLSPPTDGDGCRRYQVKPACRYAVWYGDVAALGGKGDRSLCETCPQYTDPSKRTFFKNGSFRAGMYLDRMADVPITKTRKTFQLILTEPLENDEAITDIDLYLQVKSDSIKGLTPALCKQWERIISSWKEMKARYGIE